MYPNVYQKKALFITCFVLCMVLFAGTMPEKLFQRIFRLFRKPTSTQINPKIQQYNRPSRSTHSTALTKTTKLPNLKKHPQQVQLKMNIKKQWCNSSFIELYSPIMKTVKIHQSKPYVEEDLKKLIKTKILTFKNNLTKTKDNGIQGIPENLTLVTAYFKLLKIDRKGEKTRSSKEYTTWASVFGYIVNPLVVYTDNKEFALAMSKYRYKMSNKTTIYLVDRFDLWAFGYYVKMCSIFNQSDYPVLQAITESPEYDCVVHSKTDFIADAVVRNIYNTQFYAWLDIGYFRGIANEKRYFRLNIPRNFDRNKIGYSKLNDRILTLSPEQILKQASRWVAAGMFIGKGDILLRYRSLYQRSVEYFLSKNLASAEEQTITAIYSRKGREILKPDVEIQAFHAQKFNRDRSFYLGYLCRTPLVKSTNLSTTSPIT